MTVGGSILRFDACGGGSLSLTAPTTASWSVTLNGTDQTPTTNVSFTVDDESGNRAGWNLTGTSTTFTNGVRTLATTATTVTAASATPGAGNCASPTNSISYPTTLPAAATAPTAVKLYNASSGTGRGPDTITLTFRVAVPANAYSGTYTSTWTIATAAGP